MFFNIYYIKPFVIIFKSDGKSSPDYRFTVFIIIFIFCYFIFKAVKISTVRYVFLTRLKSFAYVSVEKK